MSHAHDSKVVEAKPASEPAVSSASDHLVRGSKLVRDMSEQPGCCAIAVHISTCKAGPVRYCSHGAI